MKLGWAETASVGSGEPALGAAPGPDAYSRGRAEGRQEALAAVERILVTDVLDPLTVVLCHLDLSAEDDGRAPAAVQARLRLTTGQAEQLQHAITALMDLCTDRDRTRLQYACVRVRA